MCSIRAEWCITWAAAPQSHSEDDSGPAAAAILDQPTYFPGRVQLDRGGSFITELLWVLFTTKLWLWPATYSVSREETAETKCILYPFYFLIVWQVFHLPFTSCLTVTDGFDLNVWLFLHFMKLSGCVNCCILRCHSEWQWEIKSSSTQEALFF